MPSDIYPLNYVQYAVFLSAKCYHGNNNTPMRGNKHVLLENI